MRMVLMTLFMRAGGVVAGSAVSITTFPLAINGLLPQCVSKKNHGGVLGGKVTGVEKPQASVRSPAGHGVFDLGGEKDVRSQVIGNLGKIGAGAAADSDGCHPFGSLARPPVSTAGRRPAELWQEKHRRLSVRDRCQDAQVRSQDRSPCVKESVVWSPPSPRSERDDR